MARPSLLITQGSRLPLSIECGHRSGGAASSRDAVACRCRYPCLVSGQASWTKSGSGIRPDLQLTGALPHGASRLLRCGSPAIPVLSGSRRHMPASVAAAAALDLYAFESAPATEVEPFAWGLLKTRYIEGSGRVHSSLRRISNLPQTALIGQVQFSYQRRIGLSASRAFRLEDLEINAPALYGYAPLQQRLARLTGADPDCIVHAMGTSMANHLRDGRSAPARRRSAD